MNQFRLFTWGLLLGAHPQNCRALFERQSDRAPGTISALGQTFLKVDISTSVETVSRDRHHNLVCSRRANSETVVMLVLSAVLGIHLLWHMRCAGFSCNSKRAINPLPNTRASILQRWPSGRRQVEGLGAHRSGTMNFLINMMIKFGLLKEDLDYHLIRASMVIIFFFFGYQKWFEYEAQTLIPYIS